MQPGDALLIAGKGHETGQIVGDRVLPFSDHDTVAAALHRGSHEHAAVMDFSGDDGSDACVGQWPLPEAITGLSIDSRTVAPGEAYFAIKGDVHDGHDFVAAALKAGAALAVVEAAQREKFASDAPLLVVDDVLAGLSRLLTPRARGSMRRSSR